MVNGEQRVGAGYKWRLLGFLFVAFFLVMGTRQLYNAVLPQIKLEFAEYGISDAQFGLVGSVFTATFGILILASGLAADFLGRKRVLVAGTFLFSTGVFFTGFAGGIVALVLFYGVMNAAGQCCVAPASYGLLSKYHTDTRATALAIFQAAVYCGVILSSLFGGKVAELGDGSWKWAFWIMGAFGVLWALVMAIGLKPEPTLGERGLSHDVATGKASVREAFAAMLRKPTAVLIALAFGCFTYARMGLLLWIAVFMTTAFRDVRVSSAALHGVLWLNVGALVSCLVVAKALDRFGARRSRIRLEVAALGVILCIVPMLWVAKSGSFVSCCAALLVLGLSFGVYEAANYPAMFDCIEPRYRSAATGITGCLAFLLASPGPVVLGWMGEHLSTRLGFASLAGFYIVGAILLAVALFYFFERDRIIQLPKGVVS